MSMIWLCITSVLSIASVVSVQNIGSRNIRFFPAENQSIAGVFQVSFLNYLNQPHYAFNASDARRLCLSLGVDIASKAQVQHALTRGLETCRFGWIDEHFAVLPRNKPLLNCGQSQTGLVTWRASVTKEFDVFCFNESDAASQWKDTTLSPVSSRDYSGQTKSTQTTHSASSSSPHPSSSSAPATIDTKAEPARYVGGEGGSDGGKIVLITSTCGLLLSAVIIIVYLKTKGICSQSSDVKKQQQQQQEGEGEYIETEDWTCVKTVNQTKEDVQDEKIEVDDDEKKHTMDID